MTWQPDSELHPLRVDEVEPGSPFSSFDAKESRRSGAVLAGRYSIRGFLERGATARVYLAEDLSTRSPVALKILSPESAGSAEFRHRLLREAKAMQAICHPNVATVIESGETEEGIPFLAMEAL